MHLRVNRALLPDHQFEGVELFGGKAILADLEIVHADQKARYQIRPRIARFNFAMKAGGFVVDYDSGARDRSFGRVGNGTRHDRALFLRPHGRANNRRKGNE